MQETVRHDGAQNGSGSSKLGDPAQELEREERGGSSRSGSGSDDGGGGGGGCSGGNDTGNHQCHTCRLI